MGNKLVGLGVTFGDMSFGLSWKLQLKKRVSLQPLGSK